MAIQQGRNFKELYVGAFLGSYAAVHYIENCQKGWTNKSQPVEDAVVLADEAWEQYQAEVLTHPIPESSGKREDTHNE